MNPFQSKQPSPGLAKPRPIDAPQQEPQKTLESMNYSGADATCQNCVHFDGQSMCAKANDQVEPGGRCETDFEPGGEAPDTPVSDDTAGME